MKILVISPNLIGDTILSTGVIEHFSKIYPESRFTFLIGPSASQIYANFPNLENIIKIKKKKFNLHWIEMYFKNCNTKWDIIIDLRSSLLSYLFLTNKRYIFKKKNNLHHIKQLKNFFKLSLHSLNVHTNKEEELKAYNNLTKDHKYIVVFPGGNWLPKIWPIEYFNELLIELSKKFQNIKFIIVGSNKEKDLYLHKIKKNISEDKFINLMGETLTLTSAYMKKSNLFIGNDSGLTHLAVASNLKTISLFGPTNDKIYGHKDANSYIIRTKENYDYFKKLNINVNRSYMLSIKPKQIIDIIFKNKLL